jgi:hypothetical protein
VWNNRGWKKFQPRFSFMESREASWSAALQRRFHLPAALQCYFPEVKLCSRTAVFRVLFVSIREIRV